MALARSEETGQRFYSMSAQIRQERDGYYTMLERTQKGAVMDKANFWRRYATESFNERQTKVLNKLMDRFEGKLTSSKWASITQCSQDTAYRDILDLVERGVLQKDPGGGRSTSYSLRDWGQSQIS